MGRAGGGVSRACGGSRRGSGRFSGAGRRWGAAGRSGTGAGGTAAAGGASGAGGSSAGARPNAPSTFDQLLRLGASTFGAGLGGSRRGGGATTTGFAGGAAGGATDSDAAGVAGASSPARPMRFSSEFQCSDLDGSGMSGYSKRKREMWQFVHAGSNAIAHDSGSIHAAVV